MKIVVLTNRTSSYNKYGFPSFYTKSDSTLLKGGKPFFVPDFAEECVLTLHVVARIGRLGKSIPVRFTDRYIDGWTLGALFTAQNMVKEDEAIPAVAVDFDGSTMIGEFVGKEMMNEDASVINFELNGRKLAVPISPAQIQKGICSKFAELSSFFTWRQGDLLISAPLNEPIAVSEGDHLEGDFLGKNLIEFNIK